MTQDPNATMQRYHDRFDNELYDTMDEFLASALNAKWDDMHRAARELGQSVQIVNGYGNPAPSCDPDDEGE